MKIIKCRNCGEEKEHQSKGLCYRCYRRLIWRPKTIICKRCKREMPLHAKELCPGCYNFAFHLDYNKAFNYKKNYGLDIQIYKRITEKCVVCGFDNIVELHHLDENKKNNVESNLIGMCPNHHKMFHDFRYKKEILKILLDKGYEIKDNIKLAYNI